MLPGADEIFDYVIVGAGSAGCVLADKLSADGKSTVAVIEAGGTDRRFYVQMPLGYGKTFYDRTVNWAYRAEPDPGLAGQSDYWPRGKVLGGSSSINAMVWIRGHRLDYDDWAAEGNVGWSYADVLPYFKAIENNQAGGDDYRGIGGPLFISDVSHRLHPLASRFVAAGKQAGLPFNPDFNGATQDGIGVYQINMKRGWRMSAAKAFLRPALGRPNVRLFSHAHACRILLDGKRAFGVEIDQGGERKLIRAGREVILSAGAVNSPQLLQISGIGPADHLKSIGVPVAHDSPAVGHHLQDHLGINYSYRSKVKSLNSSLRPWWGKLKAGVELIFARGPLSLSLNQGGGFIRTRPDLDRPNIQLYFQAISNFTAKAGSRPLTTPDPFPGFNMGLSSTKPLARGEIMAASADPFAAPRIRPNAFGTDRDVADMLDGVKFLRKLAGQPALAEIIEAEVAPGPMKQSDADLIDDFRHRSGTVYHPCSTCRMGTSFDNAVVDSRLKVYGLSGLRVVDASVFPSVVSGNTNATVIMVAAKAADMILEDRQ